MAYAFADAEEPADGTSRRGRGAPSALPAIPLVDPAGAPLASLVESHRGRLRTILDTARAAYSGPALRIGDALTRGRADALPEPYRTELAAIVAAVGEPGALLLNFSYEWGCTTAAAVAADGTPRMLRALDWQLANLGRTLLAVRMRGPAGPWLNLTWPGFIGAVQGAAAGRFAAAINQAPGPRTPFGFAGDWAAAKLAAWQRRGLPPVVALRSAFDTCADFASAKRLLMETPVCAPVLFSLVGTKPGEAALVERAPGRTLVHEGALAVTNHWLTAGLPGRSWSVATGERLARIRAHLAERRAAAPDFDWLTPPVLNATTRLAMEAVPATGRVAARGYEAHGPVTAVLETTA